MKLLRFEVEFRITLALRRRRLAARLIRVGEVSHTRIVSYESAHERRTCAAHSEFDHATAQDLSRWRGNEQNSDDVREESWEQQQRSAQDDEEAIDGLVGGDPARVNRARRPAPASATLRRARWR